VSTRQGTVVGLLTAICVVGAVVPEVRASKADEADVRFRLGNEAFLAKKYDKALGHYFASLRLAPNRNVLFNVARCYESLKRYVEAYRYYLDYRRGAKLPPAENAALDQALKRISPKVAVLAIQSNPPGATIYLNRKDLGSYGTTPRLLPVEPGTYTIILERPGYRIAKRAKVTGVAGQTIPARLELRRLEGHLEVRGKPADSRVTVSSATRSFSGELPFNKKLPADVYTLKVEHPQHDGVERKVTVLPDVRRVEEVALKRSQGTLLVEADEAGALILIDGMVRGFTPAVLTTPTGTRRLEVRLKGYAPFRGKVSVQSGIKTSIKAILRAEDAISAASGRKERVDDAPASVSVVYASEIAAQGDQTLAETLSGLRGVFQTDDNTYRFAGLRGLSRPGSYGQRLMVQLDGHTLNDNWLSGSYIEHDLMVGMHALDRVELVRGPLSALYGTGAFFGVVNLVTPSVVEELELTAGTAMAGFNTFKAYARVAVPVGDEEDRGGVWVYGGGVGTQPGNYFSPSRGQTALGVTGMRGGSALAKGVWRDLTVSAYYNERARKIPTGSFDTIFGDDRALSFDRRAFAQVKYEPKVGSNAQLRLRLHYDYYGYEGVFPYTDEDGGEAQETYDGHWVGLEVAGRFNPQSWAQVDAGLDYKYHFDSKLFGRDDEGTYADLLFQHHEISAYVLARLEPIREFGLFAGVRFDGFLYQNLPQSADGSVVADRFFWTINPNLSLIARPWQDGTLKLFFGRGFRAPSAYEFAYNDGGTTQIPSFGLTPEEIYSGELEYRHQLPADMWVSASAFLNVVSSLIELEEVDGPAPDESLLKFLNRGEELWTLGAELEVGKTLRRGIQFNVFYTYQNTRAGSPVTGTEIVNSPEHIVGARAVVPIIRRSMRLATRLGVQTGRLNRDGGRTEPVVKWDLTLSGELPVAGLRYAIGARNLLDWSIRHPVGGDVEDVTVLQEGVELMIDLSLSL